MLPAWRLATNSLSGRPSRTALLIGAVALSATLVAAVACAMASVNHAIRAQMDVTVGGADARLKPTGTGRLLPASTLERAAAWPGVSGASGRLQAALAFTARLPVLVRDGSGGWRREVQSLSATALGNSVDRVAGRGGEPLVPPPALLAGRLPAGPSEIVIDNGLAQWWNWDQRLRAKEHRDGFKPFKPPTYRPAAPIPVPGAAVSDAEADRVNAAQFVRPGDTIEAVRQTVPGVDLRLPFLTPPPRTLTVVGIAEQPPLGGRFQVYMTPEGLGALTDVKERYSQIDLALDPGIDPEAFVQSHRAELPAGVLLETSTKVTSGLNRNVQSSELGFVLAVVMACLSASFIITTGMSTSVTEREREMGILRCIGATPGQLLRSQLAIGLLIGAAGGVLGVPIGIGVAAVLAWALRDQLTTGLVTPPGSLVLALCGAVGAGLLGAAWPAWRAGRVSPLAAMAARAAPARAAAIKWVTLAGLLCLLFQAVVVGVPRDGQVIFWCYATAGLPLMFVGYFLLGVPAALLISRGLGPLISRGLGLPPRLLTRTIGATPYRYGFTAGALMAGLALMVALWTNGTAVLRDWLGKIEFPDAFVSGLALTPADQATLEALPEVAATCAITLHPVETDVFGVRALQTYKTMFVAFEPGPFFAMTNLRWIQGDPETARRRLEQGGAVIVAREFLAARGLGVGHTFHCTQDGRQYEFEIVGVVTSPGLEIVSKFFNIGEDYTDQALHAVFGSRRDLIEKFGTDTIQLIQVSLRPGVDDAEAVAHMRRTLLGAGVLDVGSGRQIKEQITVFAKGIMFASSAVAIMAMLVACFGVANLIVASIQARRFEFGVLRAVGAPRWLLGRLVIGEALVVALGACVLGTLMGTQGAWADQRMNGYLLGLTLTVRPPLGAIAAGWGIVVLLTLGAAAPAVWRLMRERPRDLLGSVRG